MSPSPPQAPCDHRMMSRSSTRGPQRRPRAAAELALHLLEPGEQGRRVEVASDEGDGVGEAASGRAPAPG